MADPILWASRPAGRCGGGWTSSPRPEAGTRSAAVRAAILEATTPADAQPVPDEHEILVLLSEAARAGSVSAMKVLLAHHRQQRPVEVDHCGH